MVLKYVLSKFQKKKAKEEKISGFSFKTYELEDGTKHHFLDSYRKHNGETYRTGDKVLIGGIHADTLGYREQVGSAGYIKEFRDNDIVLLEIDLSIHIEDCIPIIRTETLP